MRIKPNNIKSVEETPIDIEELDNYIGTLGNVIDYCGDAYKEEILPHWSRQLQTVYGSYGLPSLGEPFYVNTTVK